MIEAAREYVMIVLACRNAASAGLIVASHQKLGKAQSIEGVFCRKMFSWRAAECSGASAARL
jgi:hypothetical protein